jgi:hypothetical protein
MKQTLPVDMIWPVDMTRDMKLRNRPCSKARSELLWLMKKNCEMSYVANFEHQLFFCGCHMLRMSEISARGDCFTMPAQSQVEAANLKRVGGSLHSLMSGPCLIFKTHGYDAT